MILVTGGTGFLGAHLIYHLLQKGEKVRAMKRYNSSFRIIDNVFSFYKTYREKFKEYLEWEDGDITDIYSLDHLMEGITDVYHCAAVVSFQPGDKRKMEIVNIKGTENMVNMALEKKVRKFCFVSSIAALGRADKNQVLDEKVSWKTSKSNSRYAVSKYGAEREVWRAIEEGLQAVILSPSIILGPGEVNSGSTKLIKTVDDGLKFYTPGRNGFVDVRDVVKIMLALMESDISAERFVVSSENLGYKVLFEYIARFLNKPAPKYRAGKWMGEIAWRVEFLKSKVTGKKPLITMETARTADNDYVYSNRKSVEMLPYTYIPIIKTIEDACQYYNSNK
jgi:nucleoside-diphosphate-sugar epimerase